ncbi:MAG: SIR2 family protein, partial [Thioalkalivibrio sp.]|nr:SIR2 family protein [Thioalkalivibrio sp.]
MLDGIGTAARAGELALFMGAGVSIPAGLPTWDQLLKQLAHAHAIDVGGFGSLNALDQAQYLHNKVPDLGEDVARIISQATVPALGHVLLAALGCQEAVTTNYDRLYEGAIQMQRGKGNVATVMPWDHPRPGKPWTLKMHGDIKRPKSIVLTRQQFVSFDAETRPAGALLQTLLMTRHVLFVGASLNDDNVVRLAYEVNRYRHQYGLDGEVGTLLDVDEDQVRRELWSGQLTWLNMSGSTIAERSRTLEIFLDAVAAHASDDASWLLDERFKGLLDLDEKLVREARALYR